MYGSILDNNEGKSTILEAIHLCLKCESTEIKNEIKSIDFFIRKWYINIYDKIENDTCRAVCS